MSSHALKEAEYIGNEEQLISYEEGILTDGTAAGVRFIHVENGGSLSVRLLPGRALDIYQVRFKGQNMNYIAPSGIRSASYYDSQEDHFLRNFFVGQLTTVGLQNVGGPRRVYGELQGLHGRIDNTEAENVRYSRSVTEDGKAALSVSASVREGRIFGENLKLKRTLNFIQGQDTIELEDVITNEGYGPRQVVIGYHLNYGYPLLEEGMKIQIDTEDVKPRTDESAHHMDTWNVIEGPAYPYPERCYLHKVHQDEDGISRYSLYNEKRALGVEVTYPGRDLSHFVEWKMLGKGEYVLGMEPMNFFLDGPGAGEEGCGAPTLMPGESLKYRIVLRYFS